MLEPDPLEVDLPIRAFHTLLSTTPFCDRPFDFWYAFTRASVLGPKDPSTLMPPTAFWNTETAVPREPRRRTVPAYFARVPAEVEVDADPELELDPPEDDVEPPARDFHTRLSTMPLAVSPLDCWYALTRVSVRGPEVAVDGQPADAGLQHPHGDTARAATQGDVRVVREVRLGPGGPALGAGEVGGDGDAGPPRVALVGAVPGERQVDVVGVRRGAGVGLPSPSRGPTPSRSAGSR